MLRTKANAKCKRKRFQVLTVIVFNVGDYFIKKVVELKKKVKMNSTKK